MKATETALLQKVYNSLPKLECKGLCGDSCGPIHISRLEMRSIEEYCRTNKIKIRTLPTKLSAQKLMQVLKDVDNCKMCPYLKDDRTCEIYPVRPLICRLWGIVESMPCEWGCKPERVVSDRESFNLLDQLQNI